MLDLGTYSSTVPKYYDEQLCNRQQMTERKNAAYQLSSPKGNALKFH